MHKLSHFRSYTPEDEIDSASDSGDRSDAMADPASQQTATGHGESALTTTAPPAYSEKEALSEGQAPMQQPGGQLPQAQYPQGQYPPPAGGALPQTWPQGYLVSHINIKISKSHNLLVHGS